MSQRDDKFADLQPDSAAAETAGVSFGLIYDGRITQAFLRSTDRETIDVWCDHWIEMRRQWKPNDPPIFILSNLTNSIEELTPYARKRSVDIGQVRPEIPTYCAVVLPVTLIGQIVKLFIWSVSSFSAKLKVQVFFDPEAAMNWVTQHVDKYYQSLPSGN